MSVVRVHTEKGTHDYPDARVSRLADGSVDILDDGPEASPRAHHAAGKFEHYAYLYDGDEAEARKAHDQRQEKGRKPAPAEEPKREAPRKA
jgi:hypothetical protein